jgi:hypothetical protein
VCRVRGTDQEVDFGQGHELDAKLAARIPPKMVGRMLTPVEALNLIRHLERTEPTPKRPPAPSVCRRIARGGRNDRRARCR